MSRHGWFALLLSALLSACGGEEHVDLKQWMKDQAKDMRGRVPPLPEVKPFPVVSYDALDMVDPFRSARIEPERKKDGGGIKPDFDRPREVLESYPLESLRFVGLIRNNRMFYAVISVDKTVHRVKIGNYMGENFGIITDIQASPGLDEGKLVLRELVQEASGDWVERVQTIEMQAQQVQEAKK